jgi:hypothetical protein
MFFVEVFLSLTQNYLWFNGLSELKRLRFMLSVELMLF